MEDDDKDNFSFKDQVALEVLKTLIQNPEFYKTLSLKDGDDIGGDYYTYAPEAEKDQIRNYRAEKLADTAYRISKYMRKARLKAFE